MLGYCFFNSNQFCWSSLRPKTNLVYFCFQYFRGSLEELDQEEISPDESQGSSTVKVRDMAEKLKSQAERDRRRQIKRQQQQETGRGDYQSLRPSIKKKSGEES